MKSPPKMPQRAMVRIWVASLHQELQRCDDAGVSVLFELLQSTARVDSNSCGAVVEDSAKTAQWAVFSSAACVIHLRP